MRIKFDKNHLYKNHKEINLIVPHDKDYSAELISQYLLKEFGLYYYEPSFVNLYINDYFYGTYLQAEQPTKYHLEKNKFIPSSIFSFKQDWNLFQYTPGLYINFDNNRTTKNYLRHPSQIKQRNTFDSINYLNELNKKSLLINILDAINERNNKKAKNLIESYFDLESLAKIIAIHKLFASNHSLNFNDNLRLFHNPVTGMYEFSFWDISIVKLDDQYLISSDDFKYIIGLFPSVNNKIDFYCKEIVKKSDLLTKMVNDINQSLINNSLDDKYLEKAFKVEKIFNSNLEFIKKKYAR